MSNHIEQSTKSITIFIEELRESIAPFEVNKCCIYRISKRLLDMKYDAFVPKLITIGPFHHSRQKSSVIEDLKTHMVNLYINRLRISVKEFVQNVQSWEEEARKYYSETINMETEEFVKMMILDGCFIIELMLSFYEGKEHFSIYETLDLDLNQDIVMLENQLPFFVLQNLFDIIYLTLPKGRFHDNSVMLFALILHGYLYHHVFRAALIKMDDPPSVEKDVKKIIDHKPRHLVDFLSSYFVLEKENKAEECLPPIERGWCPKLVNSLSSFLKKESKVEDKWVSSISPSATQLSEAGVVFKKGEGDSVMDISFKNGVLNIPPIFIQDGYETCARNLLAFTGLGGKGNVTHYFQFLDELISTEKDVNLLANEGIIINYIGGSEKEIADLFNNMLKNVYLPTTNNCFKDIVTDLNRHCEKRRNKWMAKLRRDYFNTPWAPISFLAATFIFILTLLQTIFSCMSLDK